MNTIFDKLFKGLTDGYFVDIDPIGIWNNTNSLNMDKRWHGVCICNSSELTKHNNAFIYNTYDIRQCLINSNHSGIIHYLSINNLNTLDYIKLFINNEYVDNNMAWRRHVLYSSVSLENKDLKDDLIDMYQDFMNLQYINFIDDSLIFVNKLFTCLL